MVSGSRTPQDGPLTLTDLVDRFDGRPIPHCPGRYVLRGVDASQGPSAAVPRVPKRGEWAQVGTFPTRGPRVVPNTPEAVDRVVVTQLADWGLIARGEVLRAGRRHGPGNCAAHRKHARSLSSQASRPRHHAPEVVEGGGGLCPRASAAFGATPPSILSGWRTPAHRSYGS